MGNSLFSGMDGTRPAGQGLPFLAAGHYFARIERTRAGYSEQQSCDFAAIDLTILHLFDDGEHPVIVPDKSKPRDWKSLGEGGWHRPGQEVSVSYFSKFKSSKGNLKAFLMNAAGATSDQMNDENTAKIFEKGLLNGVVVELNNRVIEKGDGGPFTKVWCVREVPASEYCNVLSEEIAGRFFPDGFQALIEAESD